jgi:hypothetical protein
VEPCPWYCPHQPPNIMKHQNPAPGTVRTSRRISRNIKINRRRAYRQQSGAHFRYELQMAVPLMSRRGRISADAAVCRKSGSGCLPNHDQCLANSLMVDPATGRRSVTPVHLSSLGRRIASRGESRSAPRIHPVCALLGSVRCAKHPAIAFTHSSRPAMLIRLINNSPDENRLGTNQMN